jgi:hypothetical protein
MSTLLRPSISVAAVRAVTRARVVWGLDLTVQRVSGDVAHKQSQLRTPGWQARRQSWRQEQWRWQRNACLVVV